MVYKEIWNTGKWLIYDIALTPGHHRGIVPVLVLGGCTGIKGAIMMKHCER